MDIQLASKLRAVANGNGRFAPEAFSFLYEALPYAVELAGKQDAEGTERHVTGQEVLSGMRAFASKLFGPLAAPVWRSWGIQSTLDWGEVVFMLVDAGLLRRQETDTKEDFRDGFDFDEAFVEAYRVELDAVEGKS